MLETQLDRATRRILRQARFPRYEMLSARRAALDASAKAPAEEPTWPRVETGAPVRRRLGG
ncbi:hypothetical protein [Kitasatospora terrestris]|uniref:Uncharacterized protein n=1 Tax=Kitasatospora terrestris TaxID=258051 RepID=A0ABP9DD75_9ACTN